MPWPTSKTITSTCETAASVYRHLVSMPSWESCEEQAFAHHFANAMRHHCCSCGPNLFASADI